MVVLYCVSTEKVLGVVGYGVSKVFWASLISHHIAKAEFSSFVMGNASDSR